MNAVNPARTTRLIAGAVAAVVALTAAGVLVAFDAPRHTRETIAVSAQPPAGPSVATCAGPLLAIGRDSLSADQLTDAAGQAVTSGSAAGGSPIEESSLTADDVTGGAGPVVVSAEPVERLRTDIAAASSARVQASDLAGFSASACTRAAMESWLVGGAATTGASDLVVLANPGDVAAQVTLVVYGAEGASTPPAGTGIVVPAGTQRVIPLASLALGEETPIIQVTASEAPVQAAMQTSITRVLEPGGVDQLGASSVPQDGFVIAGVPVTLAPGDQGASDVPTTLRLLAPSADGTATVSIQDADGSVGADRTVPLTAGVPLQLDLDGLAVGTYTVLVTATTAVTGAVWATTGFGAGSDFGWFTPAEALSASSLVAVAAGPSPELTIVSADADDQVVTVADGAGGGTPTSVEVPAGASVEVPVRAGGVYEIVPEGSVHAGITYAGDGALAGYPVPAGADEAASVLTYPR